MCCSVLQSVAVCYSISCHLSTLSFFLTCVAVCCSVLQCVAVCCNVLQCVAVYCSVLQCVVVTYHWVCAKHHCCVCLTANWHTFWKSAGIPTATHYLNTLVQHSIVTHYCNILLHHTAAIRLHLRHTARTQPRQSSHLLKCYCLCCHLCTMAWLLAPRPPHGM